MGLGCPKRIDGVYTRSMKSVCDGPNDSVRFGWNVTQRTGGVLPHCVVPQGLG